MALFITLWTYGCDDSSDHTAICGNATLEDNETCDTSNLNGKSCQDLGFTGGTLACKSGCLGFDTQNCTGGSVKCGNGTLEDMEICDSTELPISSCQALGFDSGTLSCRSDCLAYETSSCKGEVGQYGFMYKKPLEREIMCDSGMGELEKREYDDLDTICHFEHNGLSAYVYFQAIPYQCEYWAAICGTMAWISVDNKVSSLPGASYDYGGNHHNDSFEFRYNDINYKF